MQQFFFSGLYFSDPSNCHSAALTNFTTRPYVNRRRRYHDDDHTIHLRYLSVITMLNGNYQFESFRTYYFLVLCLIEAFKFPVNNLRYLFLFIYFCDNLLSLVYKNG